MDQKTPGKVKRGARQTSQTRKGGGATTAPNPFLFGTASSWGGAPRRALECARMRNWIRTSDFPFSLGRGGGRVVRQGSKHRRFFWLFCGGGRAREAKIQKKGKTDGKKHPGAQGTRIGKCHIKKNRLPLREEASEGKVWMSGRTFFLVVASSDPPGRLSLAHVLPARIGGRPWSILHQGNGGSLAQLRRAPKENQRGC